MNAKIAFVFFLIFAACAKQPAPVTPEPTAEVETTPAPSAKLQEAWDNPEQLFALAQEYEQEGNFEQALLGYQRITAVFPKSAIATEAKTKEEEALIRLSKQGRKIGVLLPLTGRFAPFGQMVLDGISCAVGLFDPCPAPEEEVQLIVRDTKGDPTLTVEQALVLAQEEQVTTIIGPLLSQEMEALLPTAKKLSVPLITLAPQKIDSKPSNVFQYALTPESEATAIATQAASMGIQSFILFYPEDNYGNEYKTLFEAKLPKIVAAQSYPPDTPDFTGLLRNLLRTPTVRKAIKEEVGEVALLLPDSFRNVLAVAQALDTLEAKKIKLITTSRAHHPKLVAEKHAALEGTLLDTPFYPESNREDVRQFADHFFRAFGAPPTWMSAFGFDAARLLLHSTDPASTTDFRSLMEQFAWNESRVATWNLQFLTVNDGKFVAMEKKIDEGIPTDQPAVTPDF